MLETTARTSQVEGKLELSNDSPGVPKLNTTLYTATAYVRANLSYTQEGGFEVLYIEVGCGFSTRFTQCSSSHQTAQIITKIVFIACVFSFWVCMCCYFQNLAFWGGRWGKEVRTELLAGTTDLFSRCALTSTLGTRTS